MLDKYFGFLTMQTEDSVIESFLEHNRIDNEEIELLIRMFSCLCENKMDEVEAYYGKIRTITINASKGFEAIAEHIINANFDHQKQYDLLRLYQRVSNISGAIISSAKRMVILKRISGCLPKAIHTDIQILLSQLHEINSLFKAILTQYLSNKKKVISLVSDIEELEHTIDHQRAICLEVLYRIGNTETIPLGDFRSIENIIEHIEDAADAIEEAATSLEWLLLY